MTTGTIDFITSSGLITPMEATPTLLFAVPYAAPIQENTGEHERCSGPEEAEEWSSLIAAECLHHFNRDLGQASRYDFDGFQSFRACREIKP
jgi:hypothetical protein